MNLSYFYTLEEKPIAPNWKRNQIAQPAVPSLVIIFASVVSDHDACFGHHPQLLLIQAVLPKMTVKTFQVTLRWVSVAVTLIVEAPVLAQSTQIFHEQRNGNRDNYLDTNTSAVNSQFYRALSP